MSPDDVTRRYCSRKQLIFVNLNYVDLNLLGGPQIGLICEGKLINQTLYKRMDSYAMEMFSG